MFAIERSVLLRLLVLLCALAIVFGSPILGDQTDVEDNSKIQGIKKPIFVFCDAIGNHLNCMLYCKNLAYNNGNCGSDFICNCF